MTEVGLTDNEDEEGEQVVYYRCNRCLCVVERRPLGHNTQCYIEPCPKCTGLAVKLPIGDNNFRLWWWLNG
jgi:hypothetical protein